MQIVSNGDYLHECQNLFSWKIKKKILTMSSASVKYYEQIFKILYGPLWALNPFRDFF